MTYLAQHVHLIINDLRKTAGITCFINNATDTNNLKLKATYILSYADYFYKVIWILLYAAAQFVEAGVSQIRIPIGSLMFIIVFIISAVLWPWGRISL
jgi:hypothetical protein